MKKRNLKTEALIIAEITGSITSEESAVLDELRQTSAEVRALSEHMHSILDPQMGEIGEVRNTSAAKIMEMGNAQLEERSRVRRMVVASLAVAASLIGVVLILLNYPERKDRVNALFGNGQNVWLDLDKQVVALSGQRSQVNADGSFSYNKNTKTLLIADIVDDNDSIKLIVPWGREYTVMLSDGTTVQMNSGSVLSWTKNFGNGTREVSLRGEAFLQVAENVQKPFRVHLQKEVVEVLGTSFNVRAYAWNDLQVALVTGTINVKGEGLQIQLKPGQEVVYKNNRLEAQPSDTAKVLEWKQRTVDFSDAGTEDVKKAVMRYYGEKVSFHPGIKERRTRIVIDREMPVEVFLKQYALVNNLRYSVQDGVHQLSLPGE